MSVPALPPVPLPRTGLVAWLHRRELFIDPGGFRLEAGLRALATAGVAVAASIALSLAAGWDPARPAVVAGMFTLFATAATSPGRRGIARLQGLLALIPSVGMLAVGAVLPNADAVMLPAVAIAAFLGVLAATWGARLGALGQFGFIAFYYAALMNLDAARLPGFIAAAVIAVLASTVAALLPPPERRLRVLRSGVGAVTARVDELLRPLLHAVEGSIRPERMPRLVDADARALRTSCTTLGGRLALVSASPAHPRGLLPDEAESLRERLFDVELAWSRVAALAPSVTGVDAAARAELSSALRSARAGLTDPTIAVHPSAAECAASVRPFVDALEHGVHSVRMLRHDDAHDLAVAAADRDLAGVTASGLATPPAGTAAPRRAVQAGASTGLALIGGYLISPAHPLWAAMPAYQVLQNSAGETRLSALQRILATVLGSAVGFGLAVAVSHLLWADFALLAVCVFAMAFVRGVSATLQTFWQTALMSLMYDALGTLSIELVQVRVLETIIGAGVAAIVAGALLPVRTRETVRAAIAGVVSRVGSTVVSALSSRTATLPVAPLASALTDVEMLARPVRLDPGSLRRGGIEEQLTALWVLAREARRVIHAVSEDDGTAVPAALRDDLERITQAHTDAALAALSGRAADPVDLRELDAVLGQLPAGAADVATAVRAVNRQLEVVTRLARDEDAALTAR